MFCPNCKAMVTELFDYFDGESVKLCQECISALEAERDYE